MERDKRTGGRCRAWTTQRSRALADRRKWSRDVACAKARTLSAEQRASDQRGLGTVHWCERLGQLRLEGKISGLHGRLPHRTFVGDEPFDGTRLVVLDHSPPWRRRERRSCLRQPNLPIAGRREYRGTIARAHSDESGRTRNFSRRACDRGRRARIFGAPILQPKSLRRWLGVRRRRRGIYRSTLQPWSRFLFLHQQLRCRFRRAKSHGRRCNGKRRELYDGFVPDSRVMKLLRKGLLRWWKAELTNLRLMFASPAATPAKRRSAVAPMEV